jgi:outer membrane lipoprotein carrier protein
MHYKKTVRLLFLVILTWTLLLPGPAAATDTDSQNDNINDNLHDNIREKVLSAIEKHYAGKSFEASFNQISTIAALDMTETASGKAVFSHPGKMSWEYLEPEKQEIITNGKFLWIYRPGQNQVLMGEAEEFFKTGAGGAFLSDIALIRENYIITVRENTDDYTELKLMPQTQDSNISKIIIRISKNNNDISRVIIHNTQGDTNLFEFTDIRFKAIEDSLFEFKIPEGVNIVELNQH